MSADEVALASKQTKVCTSVSLCEYASMRTTIDLPDPIFREVKTRAVQQGTTLKQLVTHYIEAGLQGRSASLPAEPRRRPPLPVAIRREPGTPLTPALSNRELKAILEEQDLERHRRATHNSTGEG